MDALKLIAQDSLKADVSEAPVFPKHLPFVVFHTA